MPLTGQAKRDYEKAYRAKPENKAKAKQATKRFYDNNPDYLIGQYQRYKKKNPLWSRQQQLKVKYEITLEEFDLIFANQNNGCAICKSWSHNGRGWHVDHDHNNGRIRGVLCNNCNVAIGHMRDSIEILTAAINYLASR